MFVSSFPAGVPSHPSRRPTENTVFSVNNSALSREDLKSKFSPRALEPRVPIPATSPTNEQQEIPATPYLESTRLARVPRDRRFATIREGSNTVPREQPNDNVLDLATLFSPFPATVLDSTSRADRRPTD